MFYRSRSRLSGRKPVLAVVLLGLLGGAGMAAAQPPSVTVSQVVQRETRDALDFTGRLEAATVVALRPRVTGYLTKVHFKEGSDVKEGDVLFEIDPRPYEAQLRLADARLVLAEARLRRTEAEYQRAKALMGRAAISREEFDKVNGDRVEAQGAIEVAKAQREVERLNLEFTKVRAPVSGRIGFRALDPGNLVRADETLLARLVTADPIYAYFAMDERTLLRLRRLALEQKGDATRLPLRLALVDEKGFPHESVLQAMGNEVDPKTGTLRVRGVFANPRKLLLPGMFVRLRVEIGKPYRALLVPEAVVLTEAGRKYVFVVNDKNVVEKRAVKVGAARDGLRVIEAGVQAGEWVAVAGLQGLRSGETVNPVRREAPAPPAKSNAPRPDQLPITRVRTQRGKVGVGLEVPANVRVREPPLCVSDHRRLRAALVGQCHTSAGVAKVPGGGTAPLVQRRRRGLPFRALPCEARETASPFDAAGRPSRVPEKLAAPTSASGRIFLFASVSVRI